MVKIKSNLYIVICISILLITCKKKENENWTATIPGAISYSSPRAIDLNNDRILDIVMGAGGEEWSTTPTGIIAIDGANGALMWYIPADNQIYGTAVFANLNNDGNSDIIIGGRSAQLKAIDGRTSKILWSFFKGKNTFSSTTAEWFNFSNPQIVIDQDGDGIKDILIANGGNAMLAPLDRKRPAGKLLLLSGKTGLILAEDLTPDGRETYLSPVCFDCDTNPDPQFIFGTGGETMNGHLYLCKLSDLKSKKLNTAFILDSTLQKGYEAPPVLVEMNNDRSLDILINTAEGKTKLIDGRTKKLIWTVTCDSAEVFSQPAVGNFFGNDNIPDVFVNYAIGKHPEYNYTKQFLIDGKTGTVVEKYQGSGFTYASPLVMDVDNDKVDEVIMNTISDSIQGKILKPYYELTLYDFKNNIVKPFSKRYSGASFGSTPLLTDLDNDGKLDIIYSGSPAIVSKFPGNTTFQLAPLMLSVHREEFNSISAKNIKWGSYMGKDGRSIVKEIKN
jgi:hypothetical protein